MCSKYSEFYICTFNYFCDSQLTFTIYFLYNLVLRTILKLESETKLLNVRVYNRQLYILTNI